MAVSRVKTWAAAETLTASDLNAEFNNQLNNGEDLAWPATKAKDLDGQQLILDGDADTHFTADTDDRLDLALAGTDLFRWDGTGTTPVNGLDFVASAAGTAPQIKAVGADDNIDINYIPKGTGTVQDNGATIGKEFFVPATGRSGGGGADETNGDFAVVSLSGDTQAAHISFFAPADYTSITNAVIVVIPTATQASADYDIDSDFAASGEASTTNSGSNTATTYNVTSGQIFEVDFSGIMTGLAANDYVGIKIAEQTAGHDVDVVGIRFKYI